MPLRRLIRLSLRLLVLQYSTKLIVSQRADQNNTTFLRRTTLHYPRSRLFRPLSDDLATGAGILWLTRITSAHCA